MNAIMTDLDKCELFPFSGVNMPSIPNANVYARNRISVHFNSLFGTMRIPDGSTLSSLNDHYEWLASKYGALDASNVEYWICNVVRRPCEFWCWRVHTDVVTGVIQSFRAVSIFDDICCEYPSDTGHIFFEKKDHRAIAWSAHTWNKVLTYFSPSTGWASFTLASPSESVSSVMSRLKLSDHDACRLTCPLTYNDEIDQGEWTSKLEGSDVVYRGSAALTGCCIFTPRFCTDDVRCLCGSCVGALVCRETFMDDDDNYDV